MKTEAFGSATGEMIDTLSVTLGFQLPADYRKFLTENNGCRADDAVFTIPELNEDVLLDVLYGIDVKPVFNILRVFKEFREDIPAKSLLIGHDPGANFVLLGCGRSFKGVFYYDHSLFFESSEERGNTYKIADSFEQFFSSLRPLEE